jgi:hypothetical protein
MYLTGKGNYLSTREVQGKERKYFYAKFNDERGGEIELQCEAVLNIPRFALVKFVGDIIQAKFPRYNLVTYEVVEEKK